VEYCACGHSVATLLNPRGVTAVSHKYSLTVARHATVVVAIPSTVHCSQIIFCKLLEVSSYESVLLQLSVFAYRVTPMEVKAHMDQCFTLISECPIEMGY
jgi:hypothetical protein